MIQIYIHWLAEIFGTAVIIILFSKSVAYPINLILKKNGIQVG